MDIPARMKETLQDKKIAMGGNNPAAIAPPIGTPVCLMLMAKPLLLLPNKNMIPFVVGGLTIPYPSPMRKVKRIASR